MPRRADAKPLPLEEAPPMSQKARFEQLIRKVSDFYAFHRACPCRDCGRHRRCAHVDIPCYRRDVDFWHREILPPIRAAIAGRFAADADGQDARRGEVR